jgi:hypothetical protein
MDDRERRFGREGFVGKQPFGERPHLLPLMMTTLSASRTCYGRRDIPNSRNAAPAYESLDAWVCT